MVASVPSGGLPDFSRSRVDSYCVRTIASCCAVGSVGGNHEQKFLLASKYYETPAHTYVL